MFAFIADDSHYSTVEDAGYSVIQYQHTYLQEALLHTLWTVLCVKPQGYFVLLLTSSFMISCKKKVIPKRKTCVINAHRVLGLSNSEHFILEYLILFLKVEQTQMVMLLQYVSDKHLQLYCRIPVLMQGLIVLTDSLLMCWCHARFFLLHDCVTFYFQLFKKKQSIHISNTIRSCVIQVSFPLEYESVTSADRYTRKPHAHIVDTPQSSATCTQHFFRQGLKVLCSEPTFLLLKCV